MQPLFTHHYHYHYYYNNNNDIFCTFCFTFTRFLYNFAALLNFFFLFFFCFALFLAVLPLHCFFMIAWWRRLSTRAHQHLSAMQHYYSTLRSSATILCALHKLTLAGACLSGMKRWVLLLLGATCRQRWANGCWGHH